MILMQSVDLLLGPSFKFLEQFRQQSSPFVATSCFQLLIQKIHIKFLLIIKYLSEFIIKSNRTNPEHGFSYVQDICLQL